MGIDAGGLAREWFELVCKEIFDPDMGLWMSSTTNQMSMTVNPASGKLLLSDDLFLSNGTDHTDTHRTPFLLLPLPSFLTKEFCCEDHLVYYRFLGRVMGKAMFDRQLVNGHLVKHIYKHIVGWPIQFKDLESLDEEYYSNLKQLQQTAERGLDLSTLSLDFTTTSEVMGVRSEVELVNGGAQIDVTNDNFPEYVEACLKYKLMDCVKPQLNELLLGIFDVIPEPLLTIFHFQELELLTCGLPEIDMDDWQRQTEYSGEYEETGPDHPTVQWFWETLDEFDREMKARLLQFVTGTSGVPSRGFGVLQGNDGNIRKFTIHGVHTNVSLYPRAHECCNRIDLPLFESKEELAENLKIAVTMSATGFDI
jgi:E3 ubiquitin-protein ligase NEDD4